MLMGILYGIQGYSDDVFPEIGNVKYCPPVLDPDAQPNCDHSHCETISPEGIGHIRS